MFYGIEKVNNIRTDYEKRNDVHYDYIIRMRPDILFLPDYIKHIDYYEKQL